MSEEPFDHIWLTVEGESWAIHSIVPVGRGYREFRLWRGYFPRIEFKLLEVGPHYPWDDYCAAAAEYLAAMTPLDELVMRHKEIRA